MDADKQQVQKLDMHALMAKISANRDKLDACPRHFFPDVATLGLGVKAKCERCKGELRLTDINQYVRGYEAGGGNGNDILPGWKPNEARATPRRKFFAEPED